MATRGQPTFWDTLTGKGHQTGGLIDYMGTPSRNVEAYQAQQQQEKQMEDQENQVANASGNVNASRSMHRGTTSVVQPQEMNFTLPQNLGHSGIPNMGVPAEQLKDLSNPYSQTT